MMKTGETICVPLCSQIPRDCRKTYSQPNLQLPRRLSVGDDSMLYNADNYLLCNERVRTFYSNMGVWAVSWKTLCMIHIPVCVFAITQFLFMRVRLLLPNTNARLVEVRLNSTLYAKLRSCVELFDITTIFPEEQEEKLFSA